MASDDKPTRFPLFKGATRNPLFAGVPLVPLIVGAFFIYGLTLVLGIFWWLAIIPMYVGMRLIVKYDDKAFTIWGLWLETTFRNRNKGFWKASSYAPATYDKRHRYER